MKHISAIAKNAMPNLWQPETADEVELAFLARQLVQITLPHTDPGDVPLWTRRNGNPTLVMTRSNVDERRDNPNRLPIRDVAAAVAVLDQQ